jgi:hypothetical protein
MWRHARCAEPTVNHELGRRDVFRLVGRKKEHGVRHVPAIAHPSHGHLPMARRDQRFGISAAAFVHQPSLDQGVFIRPGITVLIRTFCGAYLTAVTRENWINAAFDAA